MIFDNNNLLPQYVQLGSCAIKQANEFYTAGANFWPYLTLVTVNRQLSLGENLDICSILLHFASRLVTEYAHICSRQSSSIPLQVIIFLIHLLLFFLFNFRTDTHMILTYTMIQVPFNVMSGVILIPLIPYKLYSSKNGKMENKTDMVCVVKKLS